MLIAGYVLQGRGSDVATSSAFLLMTALVGLELLVILIWRLFRRDEKRIGFAVDKRPPTRDPLLSGNRPGGFRSDSGCRLPAGIFAPHPCPCQMGSLVR